MKLDRNINGTGLGKYGLVKNRVLFGDDLTEENRKKAQDAVAMLYSLGVIEWGEPGTESEFFVIKLRDTHARVALRAYAADIAHMSEYREDVRKLAERAGPASPFCKKPD
jgi:hypothetical protein